MIKVRGYDVNMTVYRDGTPIATVCATNISRKLSSGSISLLTKNAGRKRVYKGTVLDEAITLDGVRTLDMTTSWQAEDFEDNIGETIQIVITYTDSAGNRLSYDGYALVTGVDDNNGAGEYSSFSVSMQRSGAWTKTASSSGAGGGGGVPAGEQIIDSDWWEAVPGTTELSAGAGQYRAYALTDIVEVLDVVRDGRGHVVISTGTPENLQVKWDSVNHKLVFDATIPFGQDSEGNPEKVFILFKTTA